MSPPRDDEPPSSDDGPDGDETTADDGTGPDTDGTGPGEDGTGPDRDEITPDVDRDGDAPTSRANDERSREPTAGEEPSRDPAPGGAPPRDRSSRRDDGEPHDRRSPDHDRQEGRDAPAGRGPADPLSEPGAGPRSGGDRRPRSTEPPTDRRGDGSAAGTRGPASGGGTDRPGAPPAHRARESEREHWLVTFLVDVASSAVAVLLVGFFLFTVSGVWPPMVAVESPSMTPHMKTGDLVFVMEEHRFAGSAAQGDTGVVTARVGDNVGYYKFSEPGDVIVYEPNGNGDATPIIHRAMFWVEDGEKWYDRADKGAVGNADSCQELANCPAPHAGFITKGDANGVYDQVTPDPRTGPVKPEWVVGTAEQRVPGIGCIRLRSESCGFGLDTMPVSGMLNASS